MGKPLLKQILRDRLLERGYTLKEGARRLGIPENSVRAWISRGRFPRQELASLAGLAGLPNDPGELARQYEFQIAKPKKSRRRQREELEHSSLDLGQALGHIDSRVSDYGRLYDDFGQDVRLLFGAMRAGDIFVYCSLDQTPYEIDEAGWPVTGPDVARAVERGSYFIYLYPDEELIEQMRKCGLRRLPEPSEFEQMLNRFKDRLQKVPSGPDQKKIEAQVYAVKVKCAAFMVPGHKFVLFRPKSAEYPARALARFPTGTKERELLLHLPLTEEITNQFVNLVMEALKRAKREDLLALFV